MMGANANEHNKMREILHYSLLFFLVFWFNGAYTVLSNVLVHAKLINFCYCS